MVKVRASRRVTARNPSLTRAPVRTGEWACRTEPCARAARGAMGGGTASAGGALRRRRLAPGAAATRPATSSAPSCRGGSDRAHTASLAPCRRPHTAAAPGEPSPVRLSRAAADRFPPNSLTSPHSPHKTDCRHRCPRAHAGPPGVCRRQAAAVGQADCAFFRVVRGGGWAEHPAREAAGAGSGRGKKRRGAPTGPAGPWTSRIPWLMRPSLLLACAARKGSADADWPRPRRAPDGREIAHDRG
jgi:hypothetical protein